MFENSGKKQPGKLFESPGFHGIMERVPLEGVSPMDVLKTGKERWSAMPYGGFLYGSWISRFAGSLI